MFILNRIQGFIESLEERDFYKYLSLFIVTTICLVVLLFFLYNRATDAAINRIAAINESRETVQQILTSSKKVTQQREEINNILAKDENFKIGDFFDNALSSLRLSDKKQGKEYSHIDHDGAYREIILKSRLTDMTMKELCELLYSIEKNPRLYSKDLEITKSRKGNLDINLTIATLEPKVST